MVTLIRTNINIIGALLLTKHIVVIVIIIYNRLELTTGME